MPATLATLNAITKEIYEGKLREQLNDEVVTLKRIERSSAGVTNETGGRYVTFPIHTKRNSGIGARNESEALPVAGQQGTAAARIGLKYLYGAAQLTGQAIELIETNQQAFLSALELELDGLKDDLLVDQNRQVYGTGRGDLATVVSAAGAVVTVNNAMYFQEDMLVDVITLPSTVAFAGRKVVSVDLTANTVTLDASTAATVGQVIVRAGNLNREWTGLGAIVNNTGTLYNIDPTTVGVWKSTVQDNAGGSISEGVMTLTSDLIRTLGGGTPSVIFTTLAIRREYFALLSQQRQFVNTAEFKGGFSGIAFTTDKGDIPVMTDIMAPPGTMWFLNEKNLKIYRSKDWSFMDRDGSKWQRKIGFDAYEATMYQYSEMGTDRRNAHAKIINIAEN